MVHIELICSRVNLSTITLHSFLIQLIVLISFCPNKVEILCSDAIEGHIISVKQAKIPKFGSKLQWMHLAV